MLLEIKVMLLAVEVMLLAAEVMLLHAEVMLLQTEAMQFFLIFFDDFFCVRKNITIFVPIFANYEKSNLPNNTRTQHNHATCPAAGIRCLEG